jgi:hypothetical protein
MTSISTVAVTTPVATPVTTPNSSATILFKYADGSQLYKMSAKNFATRFPVWEANRTIDEAHVKDLEATIRTPTDIQGPFSVITYTDEEGKSHNRVIDGQHRQEVLRRYFEWESTAEDFDILVRRYVIENLSDAVKIFQIINHAKPMVYKGSTTERLHEFVSALKRHYIRERAGAPMVALIRPNTVRPFLATETLEEMLRVYKIHERDDLTVEQFIAHADAMNAYYATNIRSINGRFTKATLERAVEYNFYLGLDPKCSWLLALSPK